MVFSWNFLNKFKMVQKYHRVWLQIKNKVQVLQMSKPKFKVQLEICSNCKSHQWCTRHNESNYSSLALEIEKAIKSHDSSIDVEIFQVGGQRMGSFQITCNGTLLFSKLNLGYFPHVPSATARILSFIEDSKKGGDLKKYTQAKNVSPNKAIGTNSSMAAPNSPNKQPRSPAKRIKYSPDYKDPSIQQQNSFVIGEKKQQHHEKDHKQHQNDQSHVQQHKNNVKSEDHQQKHNKNQPNKSEEKKQQVHKPEEKKKTEQNKKQQVHKPEKKKTQQPHKNQTHQPNKEDHKNQTNLNHKQETKKEEPKKQEHHSEHPKKEEAKKQEHPKKDTPKQNKEDHTQFILNQNKGDESTPATQKPKQQKKVEEPKNIENHNQNPNNSQTKKLEKSDTKNEEDNYGNEQFEQQASGVSQIKQE